jgi:hypothetical protein
MIADCYLRGHSGLQGLEGVQRLYGVDVVALVSYDRAVHTDENNGSLGYLTIVGADVPSDGVDSGGVGGDGNGGGGALGWPLIFALLATTAFRRFLEVA